MPSFHSTEPFKSAPTATANKTAMAEKLCLQWKDFTESVKAAFGNLKEDTDFTDVTLFCEDGNQIRAHKVVLAASSPTLQKVLKRSQHPQPMIYMRGLKSEVLSAMIDFLYSGEANILQENLDSFLALADELQLKGLTGQDRMPQQEVTSSENVKQLFNGASKIPEHLKSKTEAEDPSNAVEVLRFDTEGVGELAEKAKSLMEKTSSLTPDGKRSLYACKVCGKEGQSINVQQHIEGKHLEGAVLPCNVCGKTSRSRRALQLHKRNYH